jgi:hypothetical protein
MSTVPIKVGDRVHGRFTGQPGTVVQVTEAGVYVHFDGEDKPYEAMLHTALHLVPERVSSDDSPKSRCAVCRKEDDGGTGVWACHVDLDITPVHKGACFAAYQTQKYAQFGPAKEVLDELARARAKFPRRQASAHEGFAVLDEERDELWDEVKGNHAERTERMRTEAIQVAAMAIRFIEDVCDGE